ncbi:MAG: bacterioferritin [Geminicoccaceae bacterium]|nr:bacterioferritin [Geminicoccaceae bacterium]MDW8341407.1 bacterioferritin [Geminicoccaceae bacterium]
MPKLFKGDPSVIAALNEALGREVTALDQYLVHAHMLETWGFEKRARNVYGEHIDGRMHIENLVERIVALGGRPDLRNIGTIYIGENLKDVIECDLRLEFENILCYRKVVEICEQAKDYVSRDLMVRVLRDAEGYHDRLRRDLEMIEMIGIENFALSQIGELEL